MIWNFATGFIFGAILFDILWRITFFRWMKLYNKQQEHTDIQLSYCRK